MDPRQGGTANNYVYVLDPVNDFDLDGNLNWKRIGATVAICGAIGSMIPGPVGIAASAVSAAAYAAIGDRKNAIQMAATAAVAGFGGAALAKGAKMAGNAGLNRLAVKAWAGGAVKMTEHFGKHGASLGYKTAWGYTAGALRASSKAVQSHSLQSGGIVSRTSDYKFVNKYMGKLTSFMKGNKKGWNRWLRR